MYLNKLKLPEYYYSKMKKIVELQKKDIDMDDIIS